MTGNPLDLQRPELFRSEGYIDGKWIKTASNNAPFDCIDPGTGKPFAKCEAMSAQDVKLAVEAATRAFAEYSKELPRVRAQKLLKLEASLRENKNDLARILVHETGKPLAQALFEVDYAASFPWWAAGEAERCLGETIPGCTVPFMKYLTIQQPIGPVALMTPWNFPLALGVCKIVTALAAGCTAVLKPSPETPFTSLAVAQLVTEAGFAAGVLNVVTASHQTTPEIGLALCEHPDIKKVSFTGSTNIGKLILKQCASTLKKVTLELGGNGAFVIFDDADIDAAVEGLMTIKWLNSGQVCVTANRVLVQEGIAKPFADKFAARMKSDLKTGHGLDPSSTLGSVTTPQSIPRAERLVKEAIERGAKLVTGGKRMPGEGYFFEPTLLTDVDPGSDLAREELFNPVAAVQTFKTEQEALDRVNDTEYGLTSYVYTQNLGRAWRCIEGIQCGSVGINAPIANTVEAPFGGIRHSGLGKELGFGHGIKEFQITKTAAINVS